MSSRKKPTLSGCDKCGCTVLIKDAQRHSDFCGKPLDEWEISMVRPRVAMKGFLTHVDKVTEYLPPDSIGWTRTHSVLVHPSTLDLLGATPRQPVRLVAQGTTLVGTLWPCKELGTMKICVTSKSFPREKLASLELIWEYENIPRMAVSLPKEAHADVPLREYLEMYLSNCFVEPELPVTANYYGRDLQVTPHAPLDVNMQNLSLGDGEIESRPILCLQTGCSISIIDMVESDSIDDVTKPSLDGIGGMEIIKKTITDYVITPFLRDGSCCSVLLWGLPGSGKTGLLKALSNVLGASAFYFQSMDELYERSSLITPGSVVILDWPSVEKENKAYSHLIQLLEGGKPAAVVLSVRQADDLELGIRVRFPVEVEVSVPTEAERLEILCVLTKSPADEALRQLAKRTHGFTGGDLNSVVLASRHAAGDTAAAKLEAARRRVRPTGIRQFILEVPDVKWNDIGGNEELKLEIQQAVIWPQQHRDVFDRFGIDPPAGILLYGPPGCSKTLIARALANESKMNFLAVKGPELFSKWVGESEKAIRELFARARQVAPTIVFFDEIDAVGASRGSEKSSGVSDRVLAQLLTELDGLEKSSGVVLLAATNRPDQLDSALLRPGRLDRSIHVGLPCPSTRRAVLAMRTRKMVLDGDVSIETLVDRTQGYSGAELVAICRNAALVAMRDDLAATCVQWRHFEQSLRDIVPRTEKYLLDIYHQFQLGCFSA